MRTSDEMATDIGEEKPVLPVGLSRELHMELPASETGVRMDQPQSRMLVVLSAEELAAAITKAHDVKMNPDDFALKSAHLILSILPPLYYEPRSP